MDSDDPTQPLQLLTPDGTLVDNPRFPWEGSDEDLVDMLRQMTTARRFDVEAQPCSVTANSACGRPCRARRPIRPPSPR